MHLPTRALSPSLTLSLALLLALPAAVRAVFQDEVGDVDYHHELLGVPQPDASFFHRPRPDEKASLLYTLSDLGLLGAVNPSTGALVWRHALAANTSDAAGFLRAAHDQTWLAAAVGSDVTAWDALTGRNLWALPFAGRVTDLEVTDMTNDVLALHHEHGAFVARRLRGVDGHLLWEFRTVTSDVPLQVSTNGDKVFVVALHGSLLSYTLKVVVLDTLTGAKLDEIAISTKGEVQKPRDVTFVGANSAAAVVAWTDHAMTTLKLNLLGTKAKHEFALPPDTLHVDVHAPHAAHAAPHLLVYSRTPAGSKADVYHIDRTTGAVARAYELPLLHGPSAFAVSSDAADVYFTRVTDDDVTLTASTSHAILGRWPLTTPARQKLGALRGVSEVVRKPGDTYAVRTALVTDADDWAQVVNGDVAWTRLEGMSGAVAATWANIPEPEHLAKVLEAEAHDNPLKAYIHRVTRHVDDLRYLPAYLQSLPLRLLSIVVGSENTPSTGEVSRDSFGFNKLVVLATKRGKLYGLDAGDHGKVLWSKKSTETPSGPTWDVKAIYADNAKGFVTVRGSEGDFIIVNASTGQTIDTMPIGLLPHVDGAVPVDSDAGPWLLPIERDGKLAEVMGAYAPKQTIVTRPSADEIEGQTFVSKGELASAVPVWNFSPSAGQRIVNVATRSQHDPIASIGRVLGDRTVKYKYLNPNAMVVAAVNDGASTLSVYLLDTVSGQVLTSSTLEGVDPDKDISCAIAENWFLCTYFGEYTLRDSQEQKLKGYQVVVFDLYESELANDRGVLGESDKFSSLDPVDSPTGPALPSVESKTFILSGPISSLAVTQTRQGVTVRQLLAYMPEAHSIIGLPKMILEPRRPVGRDPTSAEMEEGLARYAPAVELDPRLTITHLRDVVGVKEIITAPAILESTCLVFAYGVDVFGTRVAPSHAFDILGKGFNKVALLGTVLALFVGVVVLGPMVRKKQINMRWKAPM